MCLMRMFGVYPSQARITFLERFSYPILSNHTHTHIHTYHTHPFFIFLLLTLGFLALDARHAHLVDERRGDLLVLGPLVEVLECVVDLLLGRDQLTQNGLVLVLAQVLVQGVAERVRVLVQ